MADYEVRFLDEAVDDLKRLDAAKRRRIVKRLNWLKQNVSEITPEALTGKLAGLYKFRVGDYRVIYDLLRDEQAIVILAIGHRSDIYRRQ